MHYLQRHVILIWPRFSSSHRRCSVKKGVREISQILQENTFVGVSFKKLTGLELYWKETPTQVFSSEIFKIFKNTYFEEHLRMTASGARYSESVGREFTIMLNV